MYKYVIREYCIHTSAIPRGESVRAVLLADVHGKADRDGCRKLLEDIRQLKPDLILISGDMILRIAPDTFEKMQGFLAGLAGEYPVFYGMGNHETVLNDEARKYEKVIEKKGRLLRISESAGKMAARLKRRLKPCDIEEQKERFRKYESFLDRHGIILLHNARSRITIRGMRLDIAGLELPMSCYGKPVSPAVSAREIRSLLGEADRNAFQILISHDPKYSRACFDWGADLTVSGHYHGGVWRITEHMILVSPHFHPFPRYGCGVFHQGNSHLVVSAGLGEHTFPLRIHNPRELILIRCVGKEGRE